MRKWFMMSVVFIQSEVRQEEGGRGERQKDRQVDRGHQSHCVSYFSVISVVGETGFNFSQILHLK